MRSFLHFIEFLLYRLLAGLVGALPARSAGRSARFLGHVAFRWFGFRKNVTLTNLARAYPGLQSDERDRIAAEAYGNIATTLLELPRFRVMTPEDLRRMVRFPEAERFRDAMGRGKGAVLLTAHLGSWEIIAPALLALTDIPIVALYKPQSNRFIDRDIVSLRTRFGTGLVPMGVAIREIFRLLSEGRGVLVAADQSAPKESIRIPFFGTDIPVFQGPAVFCLKTGAALLSLFAVRQPDGSYELLCREIAFDDLKYNDESVKELTRRHVAETETMIRRFPGQWMWMHKRWKHAGEADGTH